MDIATAFLQGLNYQEVISKAASLGHEHRQVRRVWLCPPANVWRHLRNIPASTIKISDSQAAFHCLVLMKAIYGLVDGPLLFQLALLEFLTTKLPMVRSLHDENFLYFTSGWTLIAVFVIHVDDILLCASSEFLSRSKRELEARFGKLKNHQLPLIYTGVKHSRLPDGGVLLDQDHYLDKLTPIPLTKIRMKNSAASLTTEEHFEYRSLICSMLWLCLTRMDLVSDVVALQCNMIAPTIAHAKEANNALARAKRNGSGNGLYFRRLRFPIKVQGIGDAGQANSRSLYAQEGKLCLIMEDRPMVHGLDEWLDCGKVLSFSGFGHPVFVNGKKGLGSTTVRLTPSLWSPSVLLLWPNSFATA